MPVLQTDECLMCWKTGSNSVCGVFPKPKHNKKHQPPQPVGFVSEFHKKSQEWSLSLAYFSICPLSPSLFASFLYLHQKEKKNQINKWKKKGAWCMFTLVRFLDAAPHQERKNMGFNTNKQRWKKSIYKLALICASPQLVAVITGNTDFRSLVLNGAWFV